MPGCVLRVHVPESAPLAEVLSWLPVEPVGVYRKGEPLRARSDRVRTHSGFNLLVSEEDGEHLPAQVTDAEAFLGEYRDTLARLRIEVGAQLAIDFGTDFPERLMIRTHELPPSLLLACGELGVSILVSVYRTDDSDE